jgi:NAD(P)H-dependent flavin oxidoreductase YrpB (nitropropane dioxygenase family)
MTHPKIIQGGMGIGVSGWRLARAVSKAGQLGVVSGTALAIVLTRQLQLGDPGAHLRRALEHFPFPEMAERVRQAYFMAGGKPAAQPFKPMALPALPPSAAFVELTVVANFVEVFLAREGHDGIVGVNFLEKVQLCTLPSLYGVMLAGADYVLMGAGIPRSIPGVLDRLARGEPAELKIDVDGATAGAEHVASFDPRAFGGGPGLALKRPQFLAIVASATLATTLARKSNGRVDGFVIEGESAGGHNAPPRGPLQLSPSGEPVYGPRDVPDLEKIRALGLPFWLAGSYGRPAKLAEAESLGAAGIQVGTPFAFCEESGIHPRLKQQAIQLSRSGRARVLTDPAASPTGFPFKVAQMEGTLSNADQYAARERICDLGFLRIVFQKPDGSMGYRCPGEPIEDFVKKGGAREETRDRKCLCNGLAATIGLGQMRPGHEPEPAIVTAGNDIAHIVQFVPDGADSYSAADVLCRLMAGRNSASA